MPDIFIKSDLYDPVKQKYLVFGHLKTGDMFGEQSALNDILSSYSVVACSAKVEYYKIHRSNFLQHFGGEGGNHVNEMRARMILRNNWFMSKLSMIEVMGINSNINLEFASQDDINPKAKCTAIKEESFMKNNVRLQQATKTADEKPEGEMTERQKRIAELKKQLLAPMEKKKPAGGPVASNSAAAPKIEMQDKFKKVMDWGTPRLVTKNRQLNLDVAKLESRNLLMNLANVRKGVIEEKPNQPKQQFNTASVASFRKRMMEEEMKSENLEKTADSK